MKKRFYIPALLMMLTTAACKKNFLDVVPDNVPTLDNAFTMRSEAEKYLATCYSYLPNDGDPVANVAYQAGDEFWLAYPPASLTATNWNIARGSQNVVRPYGNIWDGDGVQNVGYDNLFTAIRTCNTFLENVGDVKKIPDLPSDERTRWLGEVKFLKAYYHFLLLRQYGPIPIMDKSIPINAPLEETKVRRQPVDSVVNYIAGLYDNAVADLPVSLLTPSTELGRITKAVALSMKAKVLVLGASPLFNGNNDYATFKDKQGTQLVNTTFSAEKWQRAAAAGAAAIKACEEAGIYLYKFINTTGFNLTPQTITQMSIRNAVCEKWNQEWIWASAESSTWQLQYSSMAHIDPNNSGNSSIYGTLGPTMQVVRQFYSKNGVPISEDKTIDFSNANSLRTANHDERIDFVEGYQTARINYDREPRFYADLGFDGGRWYMQNSPSKTDENTWSAQLRLGQFGAGVAVTITTYYPKKLVNWKFAYQSNNSSHIEDYPLPTMRLADLYLLYAEALNEASGPSEEVYKYLNLIRERAGLPTVQNSWTNFSNQPGNYLSKEGLRSIIRNERNIELSFEGHRFWDLRRWKLSGQLLNGNITGWDRSGTADRPDLFYTPTTYFNMKFVVPRDYLWPIRESNLTVNENLVQNPGW
ncbi:RagB/SusD family nutrient uptake outer membrane protein [Paraflavitalea sp. CAU 1676]|uniref:RagB/SusD family nutrient uptake outer membrane protein n=1 Tax=Paraflavitalea sp. CAU 1676 TaxID=3032598 RepID=UPI0023DCD560|nr:RagB/SusD family nutrient uptake outer membrane protein [Paraflavitalea sp. CAU 1676]MDF2188274.1 RagB/SusD family nutrient uptake outer membrane protein [Paraflavitalea sp. CAU 1676]